MMSRTKKYDFIALENAVNHYYFKALESDSNEDKSEFFKSVYKLAYGILEVSKYDVDFDHVAHDYSTLMFERVFIKNQLFYTKSDRIPFTQYIKLNIRNVVFNRDDNVYTDVLEDLKFIVDDINYGDFNISTMSSNSKFDSLGGDLYNALLKFYSVDQLKQMLHVSLDLIFDSGFQPISRDIPKDLQVFSITLICLAKKIVSDNRLYNINNYDSESIKNALDSSLRSSSFLALMSDNPSYIPFFMALDIDSIYRLSTVSGGTRITVPSLRYITNLINTSVVATSVIKDSDKRYLSYKNITEISEDFDIKSSNGGSVSKSSLQKSISKALDIYDTIGHDEKSEPLLQALGFSVKSIEKLVDSVSGKSSKTVLEYLVEYENLIHKLKDKLKNKVDDHE